MPQVENIDNKELKVELIENITKVYPEIKNVDVKYSINKFGEYITKVKLVFKRKRISTQKKDFTLRRSLNSARDAVIKQLGKISNAMSLKERQDRVKTNFYLYERL
jgi:hypothetical protein